jgi:hypothetical protein
MKVKEFTNDVLENLGGDVMIKITEYALDYNRSIKKMCRINNSSSDVLMSLFIFDWTPEGGEYWDEMKFKLKK